MCAESIAFRERKNKIVGYWLLTGVIMIIILTLIGGITRLSGSGLSITEWNIVTGILPPLNQAQWMEEFAKYQQTPQFRLLNADFTLSDFKFIFFWEWFHRLWARLLGFVFIIPFVYFLVKKYFTKDMVLPFAGMFILGALQGSIGWIMVASGLTGDAIYVRPTRLALHFTCAMILACYVFWFAMKLLTHPQEGLFHRGLKNFVIIILGVLLFQFVYGALMAGFKAAPAASTWPDINGAWVPDGMSSSRTGHPLIENVITIHFIHRGVAYLLTLLILIYTVKVSKIKQSVLLNKWKYIPLMLVIVQVILGVLTIITSLKINPNDWGTFETLALLHQMTAMFLMLSLMAQLYLLSRKNLTYV